MALGGLIAGLVVALLSGTVSRFTVQREESSLAAFYLVSLALGVILISIRGNSLDLTHILFGTVLALDRSALVLIAGIATVTLLVLAVLWRALALESLDPAFFRTVSRAGPLAHYAFLVVLVLNLVGGFQALGTLLAVGLMVLPAAAARFWVQRLEPMCLLATALGMVSSYLGLVLSYAVNLAAGPSIVLVAGAFYFLSLVASPRGLLSGQARPRHHKAA
jgi:zinc/manganese transport system permease protein